MKFCTSVTLCFACLILILSMMSSTSVGQDTNKAEPCSTTVLKFSARASQIDSRAKEHPEISFMFEKEGKPADVQNASVDIGVPMQGKLVIWLMGNPPELFERVNSYGYHAIQVHYANGWFSKFGKEPAPADPMHLGKIRLEATTGEDFSDLVSIPKPDGMKERAFQFVKWLSTKNPEGKWEQFISENGEEIAWDKVIIAGSSHGATSSARFALHQKVDRVVMFCGPRDQYETWQGLPSATPKNRFFGFSHVLDGGWSGNHYCRSWQLLKLNEFGPIVDVDKTPFPFAKTRRLITAADVGGDEKVWKYLFTFPVEETGNAVQAESDCSMNLRK
jgi:hypothetical protein